MLTQKIRDYLQETLGLAANFTAWPGASSLPYFLHEAYAMQVMELQGQRHLVVALRAAREAPLADIRKQLGRLATASGLPVVLACETLTSSERKRLIAYKQPFIVPGNQLYLCDLGLDLREHFRSRRAPADKPLSPSTQAILIAALLRPWQGRFQPAQIAVALGYTAMTASRALQELAATGLATPLEIGRERWLTATLPPAELWAGLAPWLRSPVRQIVWALPASALLEHARLAGESALAQYSLLAEPKYPVHALGHAQWQAALALGIQALAEPEPGCRAWQIWRYPPALQASTTTVDPLSLQLSFSGHPDERIESALNSLKARLPW